MPEANSHDWKRAVRERLGDIEESVVEELAQHLESRFEELQSYDAVMSEWNAISNLDELRAELARSCLCSGYVVRPSRKAQAQLKPPAPDRSSRSRGRSSTSRSVGQVRKRWF